MRSPCGDTDGHSRARAPRAAAAPTSTGTGSRPEHTRRHTAGDAASGSQPSLESGREYPPTA